MPMASRTAFLSVCCALSSPAMAHELEQQGAAVWQANWSFEPWIVVCMFLSAALYVIGVCRLWRHAGIGRGISRWQASAYAAGWLALVLALMSPLDSLGTFLFSAHMVQHETLMLIAAPLLVLGRPLAVWAWGLPFDWRRALGHFFHRPAWRAPWLLITGPLAAWILHALALWLWHLPSLFEAALANEAVHAFQHITFLFTALLFWWSVLAATTRHAKGIALLSLFTTFVHTGALGTPHATERDVLPSSSPKRRARVRRLREKRDCNPRRIANSPCRGVRGQDHGLPISLIEVTSLQHLIDLRQFKRP